MNETIIRFQTSTYQELNYYKRDPGWFMDNHFHDHYQILVVLSGYLEVEIADTDRIICSSGDLLYIPPPLIHSLSSPGGYEQWGVNTAAACGEEDRGFLIMLNEMAKPVKLKLPYTLICAIEEGLSHSQNTPLNCLKLQNIADSLLIYLLENHQKANRTDPRILKLEKYMDNRIKKNISLRETASYLNLSIPHLERLCHRYFGRGLIDKSLEKKADLACRILTESDHTIEEIAWELGFSSQAYFSRFFNKRVGMTPSNYRKRFI